MPEQPNVPAEGADTPSLSDTIRAAMQESTSESTQEPAAEAGDESPDRPRGPDGRFLPKETGESGEQPPAAAVAPAAPLQPSQEEKPPAVAAPHAAEAPQHWPQADRELFAKQTPEAKQWLLDRHKAMEGDYTKKSQEIASIRQLQEQYDGYIKSVNPQADFPAAVHCLFGADRVLRMGSPEQKQQALAQIAQDYGIPLPSGTPNADAPSQEAETFVDPSVQALVEKAVAPLRQALSSREQADAIAEQNRIIAAIKSFQEEKTEAGQLAHPHFADVTDDITRLAQAERAAGRIPDLKSLYDQAVWLNPNTRAKLIAEQEAAAVAKREAEAKERAAKAQKAGSSVRGAPVGGSASGLPANSLREEVERQVKGGRRI